MIRGRADQLVTIQKLTITKDDVGGLLNDWVQFGQPEWAEVSQMPLSPANSEQSLSEQLHVISDFQVKLRYYPEITASDYRVVFGSLILNIANVNHTAGRMNEQTVLNCRSGVNNG